jgi:DNA polymerase-3 subunit gamma/tau
MQWTISKRPTILDDLYGCDNVKSYFYKRIAAGEDFPTATLLSGQYGSGKTTAAKIIAKMMTCKNPKPNGDPCNECADCKAVDEETFNRDVMMVDGGNSGKADIGDKIPAFTLGAPIRGKRKVVIVEEIQELSQAAKNSLLKALESPRKKVHYIFLTMENPSSSGFLSRCVPFKFKFVPIVDLMKFMACILKEENLWDTVPAEFRTEGLLILAQNSNGSIRQALNNLELCVTSGYYTKEQIEENTGMYNEAAFIDIIIGMMNGDSSEALFNAVMDPSDYLATFNLMMKVVSDGVSYKAFGRVPGDNSFFAKQAAQLTSNENFELVKESLLDLYYRSNAYPRKAAYVCAMSGLVAKCKENRAKAKVQDIPGVSQAGTTHGEVPLRTRSLPPRT